MTMVQKSFYIEDNLYQQVISLARRQKISGARLMRRLIRTGLEKTHAKRQQGTQFLLKLARYNFKGGPKDLAQHHDKYTWE